MFFLVFLRLLLIFWIVSVLLRWFRRLGTSGGNTGNIGKKANAPIDLDQTGRIDDAEFEEIDKK